MSLGRYLSLVNSAVIFIIVAVTLFTITEYAYRYVERRFRVHLVREAVSISQQVTDLMGNTALSTLVFGNILILAEPQSNVRILIPDTRDGLRVATTSVRATSVVPCNLLEAEYHSGLIQRARQVTAVDIQQAADRPEAFTFETEFCYSRPLPALPAADSVPEKAPTYSCRDCSPQAVWIALLPIYAPEAGFGDAARQTRQIRVIGFVEVVQSKEFLVEVQKRLQASFWSAIIICFLIVTSATYAISRFFTSPLTQITQSIKNIQDTADVTTPVQVDHTRGIQEITDLAAAFQGMQRRLGQILYSKQQLASNLSHELRNALGALELDIATLVKRSQNSGQDDPVMAELQEDMRQNVAEMLEMSDRSLNALFMQKSQVDLKLQTTELEPLLHETLSAVKGLAERKGVDLVHGPLDSVQYLRVDRVYFKNDVLLELMVNAIDHTPPEGTVETGANYAGQWIRIWIRDTGHGIDPQHHESIFEPYFRVDAAFNPGMNNRGLGLSLARNMIRQHGGDIHVDSALGQGSVFSIILPYIEPDGEETGDTEG